MINKELQYISELSSYKTRSVLFRIGTVSTVALSFMLISAYLITGTVLIIPLIQYIKVILLFNIITEMNVLLDNLSERYFPIPSKIKQRILLHFLLSLLIGFFALLYFVRQIKNYEVLQNPVTWLMFAFGLIFVFIMVVISISLRIVSHWLETQQKVEEMKQLQMKNDYNALQDQLNPHFLFNNLSVLKSMIRYDQEAALTFTQNFTDTYRYVLQSRDRKTVPLEEELEFIRSYVDLHRERLGDALKVEYEIEDLSTARLIPPLSLQILVENAIKHNVVSAEEPLTIRVFTSDETIVVENNVKPKEISYSTSKGLKNLVARYGLLTERKAVVTQDGLIFRVELPLL